MFIHPIKNTVPSFVIDAPGGGGKITLQPNYLISQSPEKVILRNFEGVITSYPEPENYSPGSAEAYFKKIYPNIEEKTSIAGIAGIMNDQSLDLAAKATPRLHRRKQYEQDPTHATLKDRRGKRDELKERKMQATQNKEDRTENNETL